MAELYNYVILAGASVEQARDALSAELARAGKWKPVAADTPGARHLELWSSTEGNTVIALDSSWSEGDPDLARALGKTLALPTAFGFFTGAGEWDTAALFDNGKTVASYSASDSAGYWEVHRGKKRIYERDWSKEDPPSEEAWRAAELELQRAQHTAFGSSPLSELLCDQRWHHLVPRDDGAVIELSFADPAVSITTLEPMRAMLERTVRPLLAELGFASGKGDPWRDDLSLAFERDVGGKRLRVQYEFGKSSLVRISQRFEWGGSNVGVGDRDLHQFRAGTSEQHLERACLFLAASLAREWEQVAKLAPPFADELRRAAQTPVWRAAAEKYDELWRRRLVGKERPEGWVPATQVFRGAHTLLVETSAKERFTFGFDTSSLPANAELFVGGIWEETTGAARARQLKVGDRIFSFDEEGTPSPPAGRGPG